MNQPLVGKGNVAKVNYIFNLAHICTGIAGKVKGELFSVIYNAYGPTVTETLSK